VFEGINKIYYEGHAETDKKFLTKKG
jgi:hypothetical protein